MTRLPVPKASRISAAPPVITSMSTPGCVTSARADSRVGSTTPAHRLSGPPAATIASFSSSTVRIDVQRQFGWTLKATALPPAIIVIAWLTMNADGELIGVTEPTTPHGTQSSSARPCSPAKARVSRSSTPSEARAANSFLPILSRTRPRPVSSWAWRASSSA